MKYGKKKGKAYKRSDLGTFYMNAHQQCEACQDHPSEHLHHILTRKTGGPDESFNWLALCAYCHNGVHSIGRYSFALRYPHLKDKIKTACELMGRVFEK